MEPFNINDFLEKMGIDLLKLLGDVLYIIVIFLAARILVELLSKATKKVIEKAKVIDDTNRSKSLVTSMTVLRSAGRYFLYFAGICLIINHLGYGSVFTNLVTAAGVGALVISLGAQSVIGDVIAGMFLLFERQYAVGDFVKINDYEGTVTSIAMRCTYLLSWTGQKIIIPNGQIKTVVNYSGEYNMAIVDVPVPYEEDTERVTAIIKEVAEDYSEKHHDLCIGKPSVASINAFDENSVRISVYQKARGRNHYQIQRDPRLAIKKRFDEEGISIPYNQIVVHQEGENR